MRVHDGMCTVAVQARHVRLPKCPQCGDLLLAPLLAEHATEQHVRNHWVCESCGHTFRKSFRFEAIGVEDEVIA
jgi:ribosomal protein S27AE